MLNLPRLKEKLKRFYSFLLRKKFSLLFLIFLLAVLPLTVFLVQKRQEYRGKAEIIALFADDFEGDLANWSVYHATAPNTITVSSARSQSGSKSILLHYEKTGDYLRIDHLFPTPQTGTVSVWFWDDMDTSLGAFVGLKDANETQSLFLGVNTNINPSEYFYRTGNSADISSYIPTHVPRSSGWHKFELVSTPKGSYGKIDGINLAFLANNDQGRGAVNTEFTSFSKIILASTWGLTGDAYYDNLQVASLDPLPSSLADRERALLGVFAGEPPNYSNQIYRQKGNRATVLALLGQNKEEAKTLIKEVTQDYSLWGKKWGAPLPAADLGIASWLLWNDLDLETKNLVKNVIAQEADYWTSTNPQSGYDKDSKAEENAWTASFLALAANMFPQHANARNWDTKAKLFAFHTLTVNESYGGITTQTLWPDYLLDNHGFHPHPHYAISSSIGELARGALFYKKTGKPIPEEFKHNVLKVWDAHKPYVNFANYQWQNCPLASQFKGKDDWYADATTGDNAFTYVTLLSETDVISDLTAYEFYILQDWKGAYPLQDPSLKYLLDSVDAKRNGVALLYYDDSIKLDPIFAPTPTLNPTPTATPTPTPTPPSSNCPSEPSYPSDKWDRVWCDQAFSRKLAEVGVTFDDNWGAGSVGGIGNDNIGFRSGRIINLSKSGNYEFSLGSDDGSRLWVDGQLIIDMWKDQSYKIQTVQKYLSAGDHQFRIDWYEKEGEARVSFSYKILTQ